MSSLKRITNEIKDRGDENYKEEEARKLRKCRHLGSGEELVILELRGEEIHLRTGYWNWIILAENSGRCR